MAIVLALMLFRLGKDHFLRLPGVPNKITPLIKKNIKLIDMNDISNEYLSKFN